ncbi:MAG: hypothetical protein QM752_01470 [Gammaproteobacteria bacterium]
MANEKAQNNTLEALVAGYEKDELFAEDPKQAKKINILDELLAEQGEDFTANLADSKTLSEKELKKAYYNSNPTVDEEFAGLANGLFEEAEAGQAEQIAKEQAKAVRKAEHEKENQAFVDMANSVENLTQSSVVIEDATEADEHEAQVVQAEQPPALKLENWDPNSMPSISEELDPETQAAIDAQKLEEDRYEFARGLAKLFKEIDPNQVPKSEPEAQYEIEMMGEPAPAQPKAETVAPEVEKPVAVQADADKAQPAPMWTKPPEPTPEQVQAAAEAPKTTAALAEKNAKAQQANHIQEDLSFPEKNHSPEKAVVATLAGLGTFIGLKEGLGMGNVQALALGASVVVLLAIFDMLLPKKMQEVSEEQFHEFHANKGLRL